MLINELKSIQLTIKILQETIKTVSSGSGIQDNLTNCAECKPYVEHHTTSGNNGAWKEIRRNKHSTLHSKRALNCAGQQNLYIPLTKNRFEPISDHQLLDPPQFCAHTKLKTTQRSRNSAQNNHRIILLGDSQVRGCSDKLSDILGSSYNIFGITNHKANRKKITNSINLKDEF